MDSLLEIIKNEDNWPNMHIPGNRHARPEGTACDSASNGMSRLVNCYSG